MPDAPDATPATATSAGNEKPGKSGTEYVVLSLIPGEDGVVDGAHRYTTVANVTAANDIAAINAALGENPTAGDYVAIPARSFRVRAVSVATVTQTKVA